MGLLFVQGIVLVPLYLHFIDARVYGAWLATGSVVAFLGLLDFGLNSVVVQRCAIIAGEQDFKKLGALIGTSLGITFLLALLPVILASAVFMNVPNWVNLEGPGASEISKAFLLASASTSMMLIAYGFGGFFLGLQRVGVVSIQFVASSIIGIIATVIFLHIGWGVLSIPSGLLVQSTLLALGHATYLWRWVHRNIPPGAIRFERPVFLELFHQSTWVFMSRFSNVLATQSDNLIVAAMIDPRLTTVLVLTRKSSDIITTIASRISSSFMPSLAHLLGGGVANKERASVFMLKIVKISLMVGLFGVGGIFLLNEEFLRLWVGHEFYGGALLTFLICVSGVILVFNTSVYNNIFAKGEISLAARATMAEAIVRIPLSIALCYWLGINGVVLAGIIAVLPTSVLMQTRCLFRILNLDLRRAVSSMVIIFFKASIPVGIGVVVRYFWPPVGLSNFILFSALYSAFTIVFYFFVDRDVKVMVSKCFGYSGALVA